MGEFQLNSVLDHFKHTYTTHYFLTLLHPCYDLPVSVKRTTEIPVADRTDSIYSTPLLDANAENIKDTQNEVQKLHSRTLSLNPHFKPLNHLTIPPLKKYSSGPSFSLRTLKNTAIPEISKIFMVPPHLASHQILMVALCQLFSQEHPLIVRDVF